MAQKLFPGPGDAPDGQVLAISGPGGVLGGCDWHQSICFLPGINSFFRILAQKSFPGPGDAPDGQMLAISGPHGVRGGREWVQNDPYNFLLYPYFMKKCSKLHTLGWGWPCSSPGCSSEGQWWPTNFFAFFTLVNLPDHGESGPVHGQISGFLAITVGCTVCVSLNISQMSQMLFNYCSEVIVSSNPMQ